MKKTERMGCIRSGEESRNDISLGQERDESAIGGGIAEPGAPCHDAMAGGGIGIVELDVATERCARRRCETGNFAPRDFQRVCRFRSLAGD